MDLNIPESLTYTGLDQKLIHLDGLINNIQNALNQLRPASLPAHVYESINQITLNLQQIRKQVVSLEEERRSLRSLANIGKYVNSSLELDVVLQTVMDTIIRISKAERGFLMLKDSNGDLVIRVARNWEQESIDSSESAISRTVINRVANEGQSVLTTNAQEDPRFTGQHSVVAYNLRSILCVPLHEKEELIGVIYADNRIRSGLFTQKDMDLIAAFANQAAVAIGNARLFASVRQTLDEVTRLNNLMDNVFASIASGVLTVDVNEHILMCNRSAEEILGRTSKEMVGFEFQDIAPSLTSVLKPHLQRVLNSDHQVLGMEANPNIQPRGSVDLRLSLTPLKDTHHVTQGVAVVLEDLTQIKHLEAQRRLFGRMVSPAVIDQLDPDSLQLGGRRSVITVLFADIRGYTSFSETVSPETLVMVLNRYLAAAADAILQQSGTIDKFLGDAVMAWFNAPIPQYDHTLRAVSSALGIKYAMDNLHRGMPPEGRLSFGVGIHTGEAVLGLVGTEKRLEYTAIGDSVNTTKRIQENAAPGQILISQQAYEHVADKVLVSGVEPVIAKGKRDPIPVYEIVGLR
jgi:adenylate cyclase